MIVGLTAEANGVSVASNGTHLTRITFANTGTYNIQFSAQFHNTGGGGAGNTVDIWFRLDGTNIPDSNTQLTVPSNAPFVVAAWNFVQTFTAGQYVEIMWATDNASIIIEQVPAVLAPPYDAPAIPSVIITVQQVMYLQVGPTGPTGVTGPTGAGATGPTGAQGPIGPVGPGTAGSPQMGNTVVVDSVLGNDLTGSLGGLPFQTVNAAITYLGTVVLPAGGATVWILPGTYALTAGITIPATCSLRGLSMQTCRLTYAASNPGGTATMVTMGENTRIEDLSLTMTSSDATTNLVGLSLSGTTSVTAKLRTCVVTVDNSGLAVGTTTNVYGVLSDGLGTLSAGTFSFNALKGSTINVKSNGAGNKLGLYMPSGAGSANQISMRDLNIYVSAPPNPASTGLYVGIYTDNTNSQVQIRTSSIAGSPFPAAQTKLPVKVVTTTNIVLSAPQVIQGVSLVAGDRVLVNGQAIGTDNGIWVVQAGAWTRAVDMAAGSAAFGAYAFADSGTYIHTGWDCTTVGNVGAVALTFVQKYAGGDVLQNSPQSAFGTNGIQIGPGTDLVTRTACTHPFSTYVTPTTLDYALNGNVAAATRYLWPGVQTSGDSTQVFYRFQQKTIMQGMFVNLRVAPGVGNSVTVVVLKSTTGVVGTGAETMMKVVISDANTSGTDYTTSVDFAQFDYLAVQISSTGGTAADMIVELDFF
jgi:hypothetical protein